MQEKHPARSLRKELCHCHTHNHQPPTALPLTAALEKVRDVPGMYPNEIGVIRVPT
nr:MAG TPA: hypothetical protein [Caudoviricetes sp.]